MKNQTYMEKLYNLVSGKKSPGEVFGIEVAEAVTPQLGPAMPPKDFPAPLRYPPTMETLEKTKVPPPQKPAFDASFLIPTLKPAVKPLADETPPSLPSKPNKVEAAPKKSGTAVKSGQPEAIEVIKVGKTKVEDLSKKPVPSADLKNQGSIIDATIQTANKLETEGYPPAEKLRSDLADIAEAGKGPIAAAAQTADEAQALKDESRNLLKNFAEGRVIPIERPKTPYEETLLNLFNQIDERIKELSPESVERKKLSRLSEAILAFGGPLLGILAGGTSGLMAGAAAGQAGLKTLEQERKNIEADYLAKVKARSSNVNEVIKSMNRNQLERVKTLMGLEKLDADEFKARMNYETQLLKQQMELAKAALGADSREYIEAQKLFFNFVNAFNKIAAIGAGQAAKIESQGIQGEANRQAKALEGDKNRAARAAEKEADRKAKEELEKIKARFKAQNKELKLNDAERRAAGYATTVRPAVATIKELVGENYDEYPGLRPFFRTISQAVTGDMKPVPVSDLANFLTTNYDRFFKDKKDVENTRRAIAAEVAYLEGVGRIRSGAVIRPDEYFRIRSEAFPTYGDTPKVVQQKMTQLNANLRALEIAAGRAASQIPAVSELAAPPPSGIPAKTTEEQRKQMTMIELERRKRLNSIKERVKKIKEGNK
jgi:hypothetical protein